MNCLMYGVAANEVVLYNYQQILLACESLDFGEELRTTVVEISGSIVDVDAANDFLILQVVDGDGTAIQCCMSEDIMLPGCSVELFNVSCVIQGNPYKNHDGTCGLSVSFVCAKGSVKLENTNDVWETFDNTFGGGFGAVEQKTAKKSKKNKSLKQKPVDYDLLDLHSPCETTSLQQTHADDGVPSDDDLVIDPRDALIVELKMLSRHYYLCLASELLVRTAKAKKSYAGGSKRFQLITQPQRGAIAGVVKAFSFTYSAFAVFADKFIDMRNGQIHFDTDLDLHAARAALRFPVIYAQDILLDDELKSIAIVLDMEARLRAIF